jgi:hypothetical protein
MPTPAPLKRFACGTALREGRTEVLRYRIGRDALRYLTSRTAQNRTVICRPDTRGLTVAPPPRRDENGIDASCLCNPSTSAPTPTPPSIAGSPIATRTIVAHSLSLLPQKAGGAISMPTAAPTPAPISIPFHNLSPRVLCAWA